MFMSRNQHNQGCIIPKSDDVDSITGEPAHFNRVARAATGRVTAVSGRPGLQERGARKEGFTGTAEEGKPETNGWIE